MFIQRSSAALKLDWAKIVSSLGLKGQTATSLSAFKKRNDDARRKIIQLENQPQSVDFASYRSTLNHTAIVDEIETAVKDFKAKKYDLGRQLKAIEAFEAQALKSAEETKAKVDVQLEELEKCLKDIRETRPLDELTTVSDALLPEG